MRFQVRGGLLKVSYKPADPRWNGKLNFEDIERIFNKYKRPFKVITDEVDEWGRFKRYSGVL